jgi:SAM-dependent methyltransferase
MLALARPRYRQARFLDMDMREIGKLQPESFDFIFGPWNILSAFSHDERVQLIRRVHGLLSPGGLFAFSAHNRNWEHAGGHPMSKPLRPRNIVDALHPMSRVNYLSRRTDIRFVQARRPSTTAQSITSAANAEQFSSCP